MARSLLYLVLLFGLSISSLAQGVAYRRVLKLMGTRFEFVAVSDSEGKSKQAVEEAIKEVRRIESLISSWDEQSQTSLINLQAGIAPVKVEKELYDLIYRSKKVSELTGGAFDISYASMERLYTFDQQEHDLPSVGDIAGSIRLVNYEDIQLNSGDTTVYLTKKGMKIGFGAIGKGYAANRARSIMREQGIRSGLVNAAGDLITWGNMDDGSPWNIVISDPTRPRQPFASLDISDMAVVTSGNYEKYFMHEGIRYAHIIDPRTGMPTTGLKSVTVICPDAEVGDALATAVFVLGEAGGMDLINQLHGIECILINSNDKVVNSAGIQLDFGEEKNEGVLEIGK